MRRRYRERETRKRGENERWKQRNNTDRKEGGGGRWSEGVRARDRHGDNERKK